MTHAVWVTPGYPWRAEPGLNVYYRTQAEALARLDAVVTVVSPRPWAPWPLSRMSTRWRNYAGAPSFAMDGPIPVFRPRYLNLPGEPAWARPDAMIAAAVEGTRQQWAGAGLVHGHGAITALAAARVAARAGLPLVLTFHGSDMNRWPDEHPEQAAKLRSAVRSARLVIAVSGALVDRIREVAGVTAAHLPLGSNHAWLATLAVDRPEARGRLDLPPDRLVVLYVGNLKREKGIRTLADAVLELSDPFVAVFVGDGAERGYGLDHPDGARLLQYRGQQPHVAVAEYLSAADVLVLPSESEGLPTILVEAGSLSVPVVATAVGGIPELLGDGRGTLLARPAVADLVEALRGIRDDPEAARTSASLLHRHVLASYDVDRNAARLRACYDAITDGAPAEEVLALAQS